MPKNREYLSGWLANCILAFGVLLLFSCQTEDCVSVFNNYLLVGFIEADTTELGDITFNEKDTVFHSVKAVGNDIIYYDRNTIASTLVLPVNPAENVTSFELVMYDSITIDTVSFDPVIIDTMYFINPRPNIITVSYEQRQRVITEDCGVEIGYINLNVDEITFPETYLVNDRLSRFNEVNIEVFF